MSYCCSSVIHAVEYARKKPSVSLLLSGRGKLSSRHEYDADDDVM